MIDPPARLRSNNFNVSRGCFFVDSQIRPDQIRKLGQCPAPHHNFTTAPPTTKRLAFCPYPRQVV